MPYWTVRTIGLRKVFIGEDVLTRVPSTETEVETAHECDSLVDDAHLFVLKGQRQPRSGEGVSTDTHVRPVECSSLEVGWRALDHDVGVETDEGALGVGRVDRGEAVGYLGTTLSAPAPEISRSGER